MADDGLTGLVDANNQTEAGLLSEAQAAVKAGAHEGDVADRLTHLVHQYRASLGAVPTTTDYNDTGSDIAGGISAGYQGLTAGFGNKITAGLDAAADAVTGKGFDYGKRLKENTDILDQFRGRHPVIATGLTVAGSIPTALVAAPARTALGLAAQGAAYGGASGAGEAIRPDATLGDVVAGGAKGAAIGGVAAPVIGSIVPAAAQKIARLMGKSPPAAELADQMLGSAAARAGVTAEDIPEDATTTLMDVGGPVVQKVVRAANNVPQSTAANVTQDFLHERAAGTADRLHTALTEGTGHAPEEAWMTDAQLQAAKTSAAGPAYAKALAGEPIPLGARATPDGPTLAEVIGRPSAKQAMHYADKMNAEQGLSPLSERVQVGSATPGPVASGEFSPEQWADLIQKNPGLAKSADGAVPIEDLHNLKLRMDELIGYAKANPPLEGGAPATKAYLRAVQGTKNQLLDILDAHNPDYAAARHAFAGASATQDALQQGAEDFAAGVRPTQAAANRAGLSSESERSFYDRGMLSAARDVIEQNAANPDLPLASRNTNLVQRLLGNKAQAEKIRALFPDEPSYQTFLATMEQEAKYPQTAKALLNQSTTASQLAEKSLTPSAWTISDAASMARGNPVAALRLGMRGVRALGNRAGGMTPAVANQIAEQATTTGPALRALIARYGGRSAIPVVPQVLGRVAATTLPQLTSGQP